MHTQSSTAIGRKCMGAQARPFGPPLSRPKLRLAIALTDVFVAEITTLRSVQQVAVALIYIVFV